MYSLSKRQKEMTCFIAEGKDFITVKKLAGKYGVSERSIHYDLSQIGHYLSDRDAVLIRSRQNGVSLRTGRISAAELISEIMRDDPGRDVFSKDERYIYITGCLLLSESGRVRSDDIAGALWISKPTVIADLKAVKERLSERGISLKSKKGSGYWVEGNEIVLRESIHNYLKDFFQSKRISNYHTLYRRLPELRAEATDMERPVMDYLKPDMVKRVYETFNVLRRENGIIISDTDAFGLFIYTVIMVNRNLRRCYISGEDLSPDVMHERDTNRYLLAKGIREQLEADFGIAPNENEIDYLRVLVIMQNVSYRGVGIEEEDRELKAAVDEEMSFLEAELSIGESELLSELKRSIYEVLLLAKERKRFGIASGQSLMAEAEVEYPELVEISKELSDRLSKRLSLELSREDISRIALTLAAYTETPAERPRKNALIICDKGKTETALLRNRVKNNITDIDIVETTSVYDIDEHPEKLSGIDLIISTTEIETDSIPVFKVSPIISNADIRRINKFLYAGGYAEEDDKDHIKDYILRNVTLDRRFFTKLDEKDRSELTDMLNSLLQKARGYVSRENINAIKDEQAYLIARVMVNLGTLFRQVNELRTAPLSEDTMMGLVIHVALSTARWEMGRFFPHEYFRPENDYEAAVFRLVNEFIGSLGSIFGAEISRDEAFAILRYLI